jgi:Putative serine dehydratase domain
MAPGYSRPGTNSRLTLIASYRTMAVYLPHDCRLLGLADAEVLGWSEEHLRVRLPAEHQNVRPGDVFYLMPRHVCTTVALYDEALIVEFGRLTIFRNATCTSAPEPRSTGLSIASNGGFRYGNLSTHLPRRFPTALPIP